MGFELGKLTEALGGGKKADGPALIAALDKQGFAHLVIIAKDGDTTNLKADNLQVGHIIPGILDGAGTRDTELKLHDVASVAVTKKGTSGAESDFTLTMKDGSTLHHPPAPAKPKIKERQYESDLTRIQEISPNLGMALNKLKIQHTLPCKDIPALKQGGVYVCSTPKPGM